MASRFVCLFISLSVFRSKAFHSLVHLSLAVGSSSDALNKEEAYTIYQEVAEIIENDAKVSFHQLVM